MKQTWTSDDGITFDTESECREHENNKREFLEGVVSYLLDEIVDYKRYPEECISLLEGIGVEKLANNILHLENFCALVSDLREQWEEYFADWKSDETDDRQTFWPEKRWLDSEMFKEYPLSNSEACTSARDASSVYTSIRY